MRSGQIERFNSETSQFLVNQWLLQLSHAFEAEISPKSSAPGNLYRFFLSLKLTTNVELEGVATVSDRTKSNPFQCASNGLRAVLKPKSWAARQRLAQLFF